MLLLNLVRSAALVGVVPALDAARRAAASLAGYLIVGLLMAITLGLGDAYAALIVGCACLSAALVAVQMRRP